MEVWYEEFQHMGVAPDAMSFNILIRSYGKTDKFDKMASVIHAERFFSPTVVTINTIIESYGKVINTEKIEEFFRLMKNQGMKPNFVTYFSLVSAYAKAGLLDRISSILKQVVNSDVLLDTTIFNFVISAYGQAGDVDSAEEIHLSMKEWNCKPDNVTCATLIEAGQKRESNISGLKVKTWANVPRGSGLGTSSILASAVVKGLVHLMEGNESNENIARLVLVLEQSMGTGGGWQDQMGGLYPGIKCTSSFPGKPLRLQVNALAASSQLVSELENRLLIVFTGQVRLANQVVQKVVTRYLQRDNLLISSAKRLADLAKIGREALMNSDMDELGEIMLEAWRLHQELDPYCSNEFVDKLFAFAAPFCCGYKLVGAGGGGFALLLTKDVIMQKISEPNLKNLLIFQ